MTSFRSGGAAVTLAALVIAGVWWVQSAAAAGTALPLWVDTDAGCASGQPATDVDDCLALFHLARIGVALQGISVVFGHSDTDRALLAATRLRSIRWNAWSW